MPRLPLRHRASRALPPHALATVVAAAFALTLTGCFGVSDLTQATESTPIRGPEEVDGSGGGVEVNACEGVTIDPGRVTLHRLNRAEYNNTVRDLLGDTTGPAKDFPADDHGYGFDNNADVLSLAPLLMEKYESAAEKLVDDAWARDFTPGQNTRIEAESATTTTGSNAGSAWNLYSNGSAYSTVTFVTSGDFTFNVRAWGAQAGPEAAKMDLLLDNAVIASFTVTATADAPQTYSTTKNVTQGTHKVEVAFTNDYYDPDNADPAQRDRNLLVDWFEVKAPGASAGADAKVRVCDPADLGEAACAQQILTRFTRRAWRRPATPAELDRLMSFLTLAKDNGDGFDVGMKLALEAVLLSPHFVYRVETDPDPTSEAPHALTDYELATRLSYFLWSSMPDEELSALADSGALKDPATLAAQVDRMLADPKADALVDNFAGQWLATRAVEAVDPNKTLFPNFDDALRHDMQAETNLFFKDFLESDRPVRDMLDADFTYLNDRLAAHYGLPAVGSDTLTKVTIDPSSNRGGLLRQASFLSITSHPNRTSPVKRGKWVLEKLLCKEPPPPPPGVETTVNTDALTGTLREKLEEHRSNPSCAGCHSLMDPIGFGFENYDAVGQYRTMDGDFPVDATGALPSGDSFSGPGELAAIIKADPKLSACVAKNMLVYALGRGDGPDDQCAIAQIAADFDARGGSFQDLIHVITQSEPFTERRGEAVASGGNP